MLVECLHCKKKFDKKTAEIKKSPRHFCSRRCAAKENNKNPDRRIKRKTKKCDCGEFIYKNRKKCPSCIEKNAAPDYTIKEAIYTNHHKSSAFALIRARARAIAKRLKMNRCSKCSYDKHVEIAHIKSISSFDENVRLSVVNHPDNLIALCPNCHWEFDHPRLPLPKSTERA
jgi:hypothetical protein